MALVNGLDVDNLMKVVGAVKRNWEEGKTVWKAIPTYNSHFSGGG